MPQTVRRSLAPMPVLLALLLAIGLVVPTGTATAVNGQGGKNPGFYENPLEPVIPGGGVVESCADPTVIQGQQPGDTTWYLYCTTDPLNDEDLDANGNPIFHRIPTMTSQDLVNWTYVGDAFPQGTAGLPDWAEDDAALWAPDVVYSTEFDQYYLFFGVTDTTAEISGEENCDSDNAIGVAVSESPTGPWTFSDEPVVYPRRGGDGCNFKWTYDPDVLGDSIGSEGILYYGSYYGGVFGTEFTLTETGAVVDTAPDVMVAIDNKYEGANVVYHEETGFYYIFLSATNCCNGALTGYSVFVGRSESPLGPYVDQYGNLLTDAQAGGTPFLTMNGNRWVGTGHNTVFQDANGEWWTIYHAVDQEDPFYAFATGFTKRPALLDAVDWVNGWPTVNGGSGPSDRRMPAPAGQEGEVSRHKTQVVKTQQPHKLMAAYSDEFSGTSLSGDWTWEKGSNAPSDPPTYSVADGVLTVEVQHGDTYVDADTAWVLLHEAPKGDYVVETAVRMNVPDEGCCFNYSQVGIGIFGDEDNLVKLTETSIWNTRQTEWAKEIGQVPEGWSRYGNTVVGPPSEHGDGGWTYLRIVVEELTGKEQAAAGGDTHSYTAYTSQDGVNWVRGGTWTHSFDDGQLALFAMGTTDPGQTFTAEFDYVRVYSLKESAAR